MNVVLDIAFLAFVLVVLPRAAFRSARILRSASAAARPQQNGPAASGTATSRPVPSREQILLSTIVSLTIVFAASWVTATFDGRDLFAVATIGPRELLAAAAVLGWHFALRLVALAVRNEQERRHPPASAWMPHTPRQWCLYVATCLLAGLAEESAYRGVVVWILAPHLGLVPTVLVSATVFAVMHVTQRWKNVAIVFAMALSMHWLVYFTGTLVIAMVVHAGYDLAAGLLRARRVAREQRRAAST